MDLPDDLLAPRPNPDIETAIRAIRADVRRLAEETDHVARRGYARVLIEQLTFLAESPETLPPLLAEGVVEDADDWLGEDLLQGRALRSLNERPFATPGKTPDRFFIEFNGRLSSLFTDLPEDDGPFMGFAGPWVFVHRVAHTTAPATSRHLTSSEGLGRAAQLINADACAPRSQGYRLFVDPRGYLRPRGAVPPSLVLGTIEGLSAACRAADELSQALRIRLVVATTVRLIDNH